MKKSEPIVMDCDEISRNLVLIGEIEKEIISNITKQILEINEYDARNEKIDKNYFREPIILHLCSEGGDVYAGTALVGIIESSITPVHIICLGSIMSITLVIAVAGHVVKAHRLCRFMYHEASLVGEIDSSLTSITSDLKENLIQDELIDSYMLQRTKISKRKMTASKKTKTDWYFGAEEAQKYGIISEII